MAGLGAAKRSGQPWKAMSGSRTVSGDRAGHLHGAWECRRGRDRAPMGAGGWQSEPRAPRTRRALGCRQGATSPALPAGGTRLGATKVGLTRAKPPNRGLTRTSARGSLSWPELGRDWAGLGDLGSAWKLTVSGRGGRAGLRAWHPVNPHDWGAQGQL